MNYLWAFMILIGIVYGSLTGNLQGAADAALSSAQEAVQLSLTMCGIMALWVGLMEIAGQAGLIEKFTNMLQPFISFLFPDVPKDHPARGYIATNLVANILGLGWACTPAGLKAMEELAKLEEERGTPGYGRGDDRSRKRFGYATKSMGSGETSGSAAKDRGGGKNAGYPAASGQAGQRGERAASDAMCAFLILNISSLQLIPVNMIVYRTKYGSANPSGIILPAILATCFSTLAGILYIKLKYGRKNRC